MRILILSQHPWNRENSFGNTYSNIFGRVANIEIAHIYLMTGTPDYEPVVTRYYQISEGAVFSSLFHRDGHHPIGKEVFLSDAVAKDDQVDHKQQKAWYEKVLAIGKRKHWRWMFWLRELAWKYGNIDYEGLMSFVNDFNPDIFFLPYSNIFYTNRLAIYIKERLDVPMVLEMAMDHYSLNRVSYNPFFWIERLAKRKMIRRLVAYSSFMYVISKKMKNEYEKLLNIECRVLYKTPDIDRKQSSYVQSNTPIKFLFTGNIYANRWKSLSMLAKELEKQQFGRLDVFTGSPLTEKIKRALEIPSVSYLHMPVSQDEVIRLQNEADVLVHVEAFDKKNKSLVRCAISTKIMDYLSVGRCILAIGPNDISSIEYLADHNVALIAYDRSSLSSIITQMKNRPATITDYALKSSAFISQQLDAACWRSSLYNDLELAIENYKHN